MVSLSYMSKNHKGMVPRYFVSDRNLVACKNLVLHTPLEIVRNCEEQKYQISFLGDSQD